MRRTTALASSVAVVAVLSAALTGCAASPDDVDACEPVLAPGNASSLVTVKGDVGSAPRVTIPTPLVSTEAQRTVIDEGEGLVAHVGMTVDFDAAVYDAATGDLINETAFDGTQAVRYRAGLETTDQQEQPTSVAQALVCAQPGQRIVLTTTAADTGLNVGTAADSSLVFVIDVQDVFLGKADGVNQLPQDGLPVVVTAPDGTVGITVPSGVKPPTDYRTANIKLGSGAKLAEGDLAVIQLASWSWPTGEGADVTEKSSTWNIGRTPNTLELAREGEMALPEELLDALIGLPVGSQLLAVVPPAEGTDEATVFVIDVVGIQSAPVAK
ncbi:hypothetical protein H4J02_06920 [Protaetiibacter sp. SSC-01]|uniref:hypothetical protein n=1 Tax=Protaetiibacter sp. SSC-01 TaxID=2759943 RepID=UPI001656FB18|nr:hypothetical protein [Protaetiibacter sp. SSC-01]QNO38712.1 hypothetical protein H4J02_06920 [Protaetiibacter sp. SSC-01]